ncbi:MAG: LLM class flavin-dependent oxidoreductase [Acidimicrobiia bacterium]
MSLGFGLLSAQTRPGEDNWSRVYDETIQVAVDAERLGFNSVWTTEHHFVDDGYMPSLMVVSAAIAAKTDQIDIGSGVLLAPLHHPLRLAEDAATVDLLSHGRLLLGLGLGWSEVEFEAMGANMGQRGAAMEEILQLLPKAWSGQPFHHQGEIYDYPELAVRPTPSRKIPILIGGSAEPAIRRAARLADGIFSNAPIAKFLKQVEWVNDELEKADRDPSEFRIIHYSVLFPADSEDTAWAEGLPHMWPMMWKYSDMEASASRSGPSPEPPPPSERAREILAGRATFAGTSEQIVDQLHQVRDTASVEVEFVARSYFPTMGYEQQSELMERLATDVARHL